MTRLGRYRLVQQVLSPRYGYRTSCTSTLCVAESRFLSSTLDVDSKSLYQHNHQLLSSSSSSWISPWSKALSDETSVRAARLRPQTRANQTGNIKVQESLDKIWFHTRKNYQIPNREKKKHRDAFLALKLLEELLEEESKTDKIIIKQGIVFHVLNACQTASSIPFSYNEQNIGSWLKQILSLLTRNKRLSGGGDDSPMNTWCCMVAGILAKCGANAKKSALVVQAENLLHEVHQTNVERGNEAGRDGSNKALRPNLYDYGDVLRSYSQLGMAQQAESLLAIMEHRYQESYLDERPNTVSYTIVVDALAKSQKNNAFNAERNVVHRAEQLVSGMEERSWAGSTQIRPNEITYGALLKCYANEGLGAQAEALLGKMHRLHEANMLSTGPNAVSYTIAIEAWARSGVAANPQAPERCKVLLDSLHAMNDAGRPNMKPKSFTYGFVLKCFARHGKGQESLQLLKDIHDLYATGNIDEGPNTRMYNHAIDAIVANNEENAPIQAESMLNLMQEFHTADHDKNIQPDSYTFATLQRCYCRRGMLKEAENLLQQVSDRHDCGFLKEGPSLFMYTNLLGCYASQGLARKAESLLQEMVRNHESGKLKDPPPLSAYNDVMYSLAKGQHDNRMKGAMDVLQLLCNRSSRIEPNEKTKSLFLHCFTRAGDTELGKQHYEEISLRQRSVARANIPRN